MDGEGDGVYSEPLVALNDDFVGNWESISLLVRERGPMPHA